jgi:hypothetical protein
MGGLVRQAAPAADRRRRLFVAALQQSQEAPQVLVIASNTPARQPALALGRLPRPVGRLLDPFGQAPRSTPTHIELALKYTGGIGDGHDPPLDRMGYFQGRQGRILVAGSEMDALNKLIDLASQCRTAVVLHRRPREPTPIRRLVEPHQLTQAEDRLILICWQIDPETHGRTAWRRLRVDCLEDVQDGGSTFHPKAEIRMARGEVVEHEMAYEPPGLPEAVNTYYRVVVDSTADGRLVASQVAAAKEAARLISLEQIRAVHGRVFLEKLRALVDRGLIDIPASDQLIVLRKMLKRLGWAPGDRDDPEYMVVS